MVGSGRGRPLIATRLTTSIQALMENVLQSGETDLLPALDNCLLTVSTRYGTTLDVVKAAHRACVANGSVFQDPFNQLLVCHHLENALAVTNDAIALEPVQPGSARRHVGSCGHTATQRPSNDP